MVIRRQGHGESGKRERILKKKEKTLLPTHRQYSVKKLPNAIKNWPTTTSSVTIQFSPFRLFFSFFFFFSAFFFGLLLMRRREIYCVKQAPTSRKIPSYEATQKKLDDLNVVFGCSAKMKSSIKSNMQKNFFYRFDHVGPTKLLFS